MTPVVFKRMTECPAYRISPDDTNYFALVFDPAGEKTDLVAVVEIFAPGGRTPPNAHARAHEMFFVLEGQGRALCGGAAVELKKGDAILLRPGATHEVHNTGSGKLYTLTVMVPNEDFAELIRNGTRVELDAADRRAIAGD
ncbi:MAG: cupin domain-containing protein [Tagaea sp.]|jgi:mannose-6-phosphate isomerase-like protein (cupin superfamily)|nr:cupin domain-containing protein [Azospirillum sp.]MCA3265283.1 cupin domain-containing protein [Azospirillum sp.]MCZ8123306.1 cupin domain-containing protein [Magnetospirillum sp.]